MHRFGNRNQYFAFALFRFTNFFYFTHLCDSYRITIAPQLKQQQYKYFSYLPFLSFHFLEHGWSENIWIRNE